jgi:predicted MFS family arabinose efflux permease
MSTADELLADHEREAVLRVLAAAAFIVFFQAYLVAPLIPSLAAEFHTTEGAVGTLVPAYLLPYGVFTLIYGPLSDRIGRRAILLATLAAMSAATLLTALAPTFGLLVAARVFAGVASGGIIPISIALLADLFPYQQRGRALGWIFGAIAGGMAFGSTCGALLNPYLGWRVEFAALAAACGLNVLLAYRHRAFLQGRPVDHPPGLTTIVAAYLALLRNRRAVRTFAFIFANSFYNSGVFSWLGLYLARRYHLGDQGIGLALLGYGLPGMLLGPAIGRLADRAGRRSIIPLGLFLSALAGAALVPALPLVAAAAVATVLSLGFDMSHPLLTGIITSVDPARRGQALGLNAFVLFTGFGLGSLGFQALLTPSLGTALAVFAGGEFLLAAAALLAFRSESASHAHG